MSKNLLRVSSTLQGAPLMDSALSLKREEKQLEQPRKKKRLRKQQRTQRQKQRKK